MSPRSPDLPTRAAVPPRGRPCRSGTPTAPTQGNSWADACLAGRLMAIDPGLGLVLRAAPGPARDHWLAALAVHLPAGAPCRRMPAGTPDGRLLGGLDLTATLASGRPIASRGLLAETDGGVLVVASAERLDPGAAGCLGRTIDTGAVRTERDGVTAESPARLGIVALDDGREPDERPPDALMDRLALRLDLSALSHRDCGPVPDEAAVLAQARVRLGTVVAGDDVIEALCEAAAALGIGGLRAPLLAVKAARASAALAGRARVAAEDLAVAGRLVLGPRATAVPGKPEPAETAPAEPGRESNEPADDSGQADAPDASRSSEPPEEQAGEGQGRLEASAVEAARTTLPSDLLAALASGSAPARTSGGAGARRGAGVMAGRTGRAVGTRRGEPGRGARLDVLATLRAAAPWQGLRGRVADGRIQIRRDDFRIKRHEDRRRTTTIFAVDASGSAALGRLAEAKGAVELLLAQCYIRRDDVALVAFRGTSADLLLPPTRSLVRVKRELASLPGGGATPLAAGIGAALDLARAVTREGRSPVIALLTDGRGNIARDGTADRPRATQDSLAVARLVRAASIAAVVIDVSPRPGAQAARLATEMGAGYVPLPHADAGAIAGAVMAAAEPSRGRA